MAPRREPARKHHRLVIRKTLLSEREREIVLTIALLAFAFGVASFRHHLPSSIGIAITLLIAGICAAFNVHLVFRNHRRGVPYVVDTDGRWVCEKGTPAEVSQYSDYSVRIPRSEHQKGNNPKVRIASGDDSDYLVRVNDAGDVTVHFSPARLARIPSTAPVKLSITG